MPVRNAAGMPACIVFFVTYSKDNTQSLWNQFQLVTDFQKDSEAREHHAFDFIKTGLGKAVIFQIFS